MHPCKLCKQEPSRTTGNDNVYCATNGCPMQGVWRPDAWNKLMAPDPYQSFVERLKTEFPGKHIEVVMENDDGSVWWVSVEDDEAGELVRYFGPGTVIKTLDEAINQLGDNND